MHIPTVCQLNEVRLAPHGLLPHFKWKLKHTLPVGSHSNHLHRLLLNIIKQKTWNVSFFLLNLLLITWPSRIAPQEKKGLKREQNLPKPKVILTEAREYLIYIPSPLSWNLNGKCPSAHAEKKTLLWNIPQGLLMCSYKTTWHVSEHAMIWKHLQLTWGEQFLLLRQQWCSRKSRGLGANYLSARPWLCLFLRPLTYFEPPEVK